LRRREGTYPFARDNLDWYWPGRYVFAVNDHSVLFQATTPALVEKSVKERASVTRARMVNSFMATVALSVNIFFKFYVTETKKIPFPTTKFHEDSLFIQLELPQFTFQILGILFSLELPRNK
jgi:hypothetical protein